MGNLLVATMHIFSYITGVALSTLLPWCRTQSEAQADTHNTQQNGDGPQVSMHKQASSDLGNDPSGEQLALALQCLREQLNSPTETQFQNPMPALLPPATLLAHYPYPELDFSMIQRGHTLIGPLDGDSSPKTRLEKEIKLATSKVGSESYIWHTFHSR